MWDFKKTVIIFAFCVACFDTSAFAEIDDQTVPQNQMASSPFDDNGATQSHILNKNVSCRKCGVQGMKSHCSVQTDYYKTLKKTTIQEKETSEE